MDKKYIEEYNLQEAVKRFKEINEYTFITKQPLLLDEEGEENDQETPQDNNMETAPSSQSNIEQSPSGDNNGDMPNPMGNEMGTENPSMTNGEIDAQTANDMGGDEIEIETEETEEMGEGDEVIDVDDLTKSQEATEIKVDDFGEKLNKMMAFLDKVDKAIELSDRKIDRLRQEFEKRNPTEEEKLNLRSQASYPYSETPKEYWQEKVSSNPHYNVIYDNDVSTANEPEKFEITTDDVKNINPKEVSDSFDIKHSYKLNDFFKF